MQFPVLSELTGEGVMHRFVLRHPTIDVKVDRAVALARLEVWHREIVEQMDFAWSQLARAVQVHGTEVALVEEVPGEDWLIPQTDALITAKPGVLLGIYVADCCAVYVVDRESGALGLAHAGRKGAEGGIVAKMIEKMKVELGARPENMVVQLSPCIRPPVFEIDFAALIKQQALDAGVPAASVVDEGYNTADDVVRYYSYRVEKGKTGRMLALLGRKG